VHPTIKASSVMKTLTDTEIYESLGAYVAPTGLYQYIKSLPFLGSLSSNISSLTAGEWTEVVITYAVGGSGLADGAWIKGTFKFYSVSRSRSKTQHMKCKISSHNFIQGLGFISNLRCHSRQLCFRRISRRTTGPGANPSYSTRARGAFRSKGP